jgi:hypothetical protein
MGFGISFFFLISNFDLEDMKKLCWVQVEPNQLFLYRGRVFFLQILSWGIETDFSFRSLTICKQGYR